MNRITLLTDFGTADGYVGAMKGVIASIAPSTFIDDTAHDLPPGDIRAAAFALARYWRLFPKGTIHVVVVDPGVGGDRRAIAARADGRFLVAPDNGVLTLAFREQPPDAVVALENPHYQLATVSATFHGRDIFAPAAAHLARGVPLEAFGPNVDEPVRFSVSAPRVSADGGVVGTVVHVDRFGNLVTNIPGASVPPAATVRVRGLEIGAPMRTYADVEAGCLLALVGSTGLIEISVRNGNAANRLGARRGTEVRIS